MILYCAELNELVLVEFGRVDLLDNYMMWNITSWLHEDVYQLCLHEKDFTFVGWL